MIEAAGYAPTIVEYLKTGWSTPQLQALVAAMDMRLRDVLRVKGAPAPERERWNSWTRWSATRSW